MAGNPREPCSGIHAGARHWGGMPWGGTIPASAQRFSNRVPTSERIPERLGARPEALEERLAGSKHSSGNFIH